MASLAGLTTRVAAGTGRVVGGTAANLYAGVKGAVVQSTGISSLRPTNIGAAILEKAGLGGIIPPIAGAFRGTADRTISNTPQGMTQATTPSTQPTPANQNQTQTSILAKILNVDTSILEIAQKDTRNIETLTGTMKDLLNFMRGDSLKRQEEAREARVSRTVAANDNTRGAPTKATGGGGLMGLLSMIPGFMGLKTIFSGVTDAFNSIIKYGGILLRGLISIGRFLIRFAGPVGAVIGVLLALESQDWEKFFGRFTSAFKDFSEGRWLDGIVNIIAAVPELLFKAIGRIIARVAEFFGFEDFARSFDQLVDSFDIVEFFKGIFNYAKEAFTNILNSVRTFFSDASAKFSEWWASFSIIDPIIDTFTYVKDAVVNAFTAVKDKVAEWFASAADLGSRIGEGLGNMTSNVWEFFKSLPGKMVDAASNLVPDFIKEPFRKLFGGGTNAQPTAAPAPAEAPSAVRSTTPVMPSKDIEVIKYAGKSKEQIMEDILPLTGGNPYQAMAEAERIYAKVSGTPTAATSTTPVVQAPLSARENIFNQQSSRQAIEQGTTPSTPVIINNTTSNATTPGSGTTNTRMGGAVSTSPRDSHIDRALYGNYYGAGVP